VIAKLSTFDRVNRSGLMMCRGATYITNNRGEIGEPWVTSMETGVRVLGEPLNSRVHWRFFGKDRVQAVRYLGMLHERRWFIRIWPFTLSKPPLMSRKRVSTMYRAI
jgi:hypothetical protein